MTNKKVHTILVVEDVDEISVKMQAALHQRGHRVEYASTATEAIQKAERDRPVIILTDLELPTFAELLTLLRTHSQLNNMKVAILDNNHPQVQDSRVNVVRDFQGLDELIEASQDQSEEA